VALEHGKDTITIPRPWHPTKCSMVNRTTTHCKIVTQISRNSNRYQEQSRNQATHMITTQKIAGFPPSPFVIHSNEASVAASSLSAWKAFQAGMQMLQRYANRSPIDIDTVAKSNLQLLHQSLSDDTHYINNIEHIWREGARSGQPTLRRLYADQGLTADLLALQDGTSINLAALPQHYTMYLLISGHARFDVENENSSPVRHWWDRIGSYSNKNCLRSGDVIIRSYKQENNRLIASGKNCLLLRVHTPTEEASSRKTAS